MSYNTRQKKLVFDIIKENQDKQLSCDEITHILFSEGTPVGKTTVYRQLERLVLDGKIKKTAPYNSKCYIYQYIDEEMNCCNHLHLRCRICGRYEHLGCEFMNSVNEHISKHHNFIVDNSITEIVGVCKSCCSEHGGAEKCL